MKTPSNSSESNLRVWMKLVRFRLSVMVTFSALTGYFFSGIKPDGRVISFVTGLFLLSSAASVLNQIQESAYDGKMSRTASRPIPSGRISVREAWWLTLGMILSGSGFLWLSGVVPMVLGLINILIYNAIYTPMKPKTLWAIVPGAVVGGIPPVMGLTAAGLGLLHPKALFLFCFVFLWQIPHFWLLMVRYGKEYEAAGLTSISSVMTVNQIKRIVFGWGVVTSLFLLSFPIFGLSLKPILLWFLIGFNVLFISQFYRFLFIGEDPRRVIKAFILINSYAMVVFILLIISAVI
ncbi:MAG: protoheme IX farnesyltransferase [Marinilabiliales bacterium]|nr:protoheme IX farnesyltransferase [Marinilabiliales bacterium]